MAAVDQLLDRNLFVDVEELHHLDRIEVVDAEPGQLEAQHVEIAPMHALDQPRQQRVGVIGGIPGRCTVRRTGCGNAAGRVRYTGRYRLATGLARGFGG